MLITFIAIIYIYVLYYCYLLLIFINFIFLHRALKCYYMRTGTTIISLREKYPFPSYYLLNTFCNGKFWQIKLGV